ncbi:MAG: GntR family transcriptional regulator [Lachnospiraceae bacterium]|jgi:DNA-binding GntR family transcriptional regulator|nr:GntR family transcriptional regulator [Lachnospiraceae bacterium]
MASNEKKEIINASAESKQQLAYQQIKQDILNNTYPEGTVLAERKLCAIYHVSRSPIRNAIQQLTHEGLLRLIPGKGAAVAGFSIEDILEVYDLMEVLQMYALRSLASQIDAYFLDFLETSLENMKQNMENGDLSKACKWDQQFHRFLITSSSNKRLVSMYEQLEVQNMRFMATTADDEALARRSYQEHLAIYEHLKKHDISGAQETLQTHYKHTKQYYINKLISRIQI